MRIDRFALPLILGHAMKNLELTIQVK